MKHFNEEMINDKLPSALQIDKAFSTHSKAQTDVSRC